MRRGFFVSVSCEALAKKLLALIQFPLVFCKTLIFCFLARPYGGRRSHEIRR